MAHWKGVSRNILSVIIHSHKENLRYPIVNIIHFFFKERGVKSAQGHSDHMRKREKALKLLEVCSRSFRPFSFLSFCRLS